MPVIALVRRPTPDEAATKLPGGRMNINALISAVSSRRELLELLQELGTDCLDHRDRIAGDKYSSDSDATIGLEEAMAAASGTMWSRDGSPQASAPSDVSAAIKRLEGTPDLATLAVLEGLCRGAASAYFRATLNSVRITRGMPFPLPARKFEGWLATPDPATGRSAHLLDPRSGFAIWDSSWEATLHFGDRDRLEQLCWPFDLESSANRLPRVATVHPFRGREMAVPPDHQADGRFFGVHPKAGEPHPSVHQNALTVIHAVALLDDLPAETAPEIAVVPEFTLHDPDALADYVVSATATPMVVAGTAHHIRDGQRANTTVTYLDGVEVLRTSKQHGFSYRDSVDGAPPERFAEDVAPRPRHIDVLASTSTRLCVAICSDMNWNELSEALLAVGVNVLLIPAWTPESGFFGGAIEKAATQAQCVSVVANTPGHPSSQPPAEPFWALSMTPHRGSHCTEHRPPRPSETAAAIIDPNENPSTDAHIRWVPWRTPPTPS